MMRIVVPTDFTERSLEAVKYAVAYAHAVKGELLLLHVVEGEPLRHYVVRGGPDGRPYGMDPHWMELTGSTSSGPLPEEVVHRDLYEEAQWKLSALLPAGCRGRFRALVVVGRAADEILRVAEEQQADLIVMGMGGRKGWKRLLRRSVAEQVICRASMPVLTLWGGENGARQHRWTSELVFQEAPEEHATGTREMRERPRSQRRPMPGRKRRDEHARTG